MSSTVDQLFEDQQEDLTAPEFPKVLKGFDPMQVEMYVFQVTQRIEALEHDLEVARQQRDAAVQRYAARKEEAYRGVAQRMADVLLLADQHATNVREEAERDAVRRTAEATKEADRIRAEAERAAAEIRAEARAQAEELERQGQDALRAAHAEVERVIGGLALRREQLAADLSLLRDRAAEVVNQVDAALAVASSAIGTPPGSADDPGGTATPQKTIGESDDLLMSGQGFDLVLGELSRLRGEERATPGDEDLDLWR